MKKQQLLDLSVTSSTYYSVQKPVVIFAITPRTGSTALCSVLNKIKGFAHIEEYFNPRGPIEHFSKSLTNKTLDTYLKFLEKEHSKNFFSFKTSWQDFEVLAKNDRYKQRFPDHKFIYIDRFSIEEQAISLYLAILSNKWHHNKKEDKSLDNYKSISNDDFDEKRIMSIIKTIENEKFQWHKFFYNENIKPLMLHYEFFNTDIKTAAIKIMDFIELDHVKMKDMNEINSDFIKTEKKFYKEWLEKIRDVRFGK